jgi:hypothetical protein
MLEKYYLNNEGKWLKCRELFVSKFREEFGFAEGCLLVNNSRWLVT